MEFVTKDYTYYVMVSSQEQLMQQFIQKIMTGLTNWLCCFWATPGIEQSK